MTTLKPGQVLTGDSVKALKAGSSVLLWKARENHLVTPVEKSGHGLSGWIAFETLSEGHKASTMAGLLSYIGEQDAEGWIAWTGGEPPVPHETPGLEVKCRNGATHLAKGFQLHYWQHDGDGYDIIAFRLKPLSTKPQGGDQGALQAQAPSVTTEQAQAAVVADQTERWAKALYFTNGFYSDPTDWDDMAPNDAGIRQLHADMARAAKEVWDRADTPAIAKGGDA
jgi:hypothetical protein